jgi:hypothetical protein
MVKRLIRGFVGVTSWSANESEYKSADDEPEAELETESEDESGKL